MTTPRRSAPSTPIASTSRRASSRTPTARTPSGTPHHKTADELAAEEAACLLHTPLSRIVEGDAAMEGGSARALRHRRLNALKESQDSRSDDGRSERSTSTPSTSRKMEKTNSYDSISAIGTDDGASLIDIATEEALASAQIDAEFDAITNGETKNRRRSTLQDLAGPLRAPSDPLEPQPSSALTELPAEYAVEEEVEEQAEPASTEAAQPLASTIESVAAPQSESSASDQVVVSEEFEAAAGPFVSDADDSSDESEDDSDDSSEDDSDETDSTSEEDSADDSDEEDERMEKLLQAARAAAVAKAQAQAAEKEDGNVLQFDEGELGEKKQAPIPDLAVPRLPQAHLSFSKDDRASSRVQVPSTSHAGPSRPQPVASSSKPPPAVPELDNRPYERELTKKEKKSQPRKATVSELWSTIPTPRADLLSDMKRDYQALALANSLDPKRFMKGGSRSDKVPESFAIGTMVDAPRHMQDTTLTKERKYRAGQVVKDLVRDDDTESYAKRKYGDLQWSKMENGRGKYKKKVKW